MKYYEISTTSNSKVIGAEYPQIDCLDISVKDGLDIICGQKGRKVEDPGLIFNLKLPDKSKITDVISCSLGAGGDMIISSKLHELLKKAKCSSLQYFPITFTHKKNVYKDFFYLHFIYELEKYIDFKKSTYDNYFMKRINLQKPNNYKEFSKLIQENKKLGHFRLTKTFLQIAFPKDEDIFVLSYANQAKYISERLYRLIIENNITGLDIKVGKGLFFNQGCP